MDNDNQTEITQAMRDSTEIDTSDHMHRDIRFVGRNGHMFQICDESYNPDSQCVQIQKDQETLIMTTADFDYMVSLMQKPLLKK